MSIAALAPLTGAQTGAMTGVTTGIEHGVAPGLAPLEAPLPQGIGPTEGLAEPSFGDVFGKTIDEAAALGREADAKVEDLASGASDDLHGTMIAMKEAEISMKLVGAIRNKVLDAFHEIWRTSV
jgi:flagellar hook-basal body complex protein FliE